MPTFDFKDISLDDNLDLLVENGDIQIDDEPKSLIQAAIFRVLTSPMDWDPDPGAAAGLERHLGSLNNVETHERIKNDIQLALAKEYLLAPADYDVIIYPHTDFPDRISVTLRVKNIDYIDFEGGWHTGEGVAVTFRLNLSTGKISYIDNQ